MNEDERPAVDSELPTVPRPADATGQTIAGYRVVQVIGEGGMGVVYEAEQEKPVRRRVALIHPARPVDGHPGPHES